MAKYIGITAKIYVPGFMPEYTRNLLRGEGADVRPLEEGSYDDAIATVRHDAKTSGALMVMDTSWEGYHEIPNVSPAFSLVFAFVKTARPTC